MKYRIVKITPTEGASCYKIEVSSFSIFSRDWVSMSTSGYPMSMGIYGMDQDEVYPFTTLESARECLDNIISYVPPREEIVFRT